MSGMLANPVDRRRGRAAPESLPGREMAAVALATANKSDGAAPAPARRDGSATSHLTVTRDSNSPVMDTGMSGQTEHKAARSDPGSRALERKNVCKHRTRTIEHDVIRSAILHSEAFRQRSLGERQRQGRRGVKHFRGPLIREVRKGNRTMLENAWTLRARSPALPVQFGRCNIQHRRRGQIPSGNLC